MLACASWTEAMDAFPFTGITLPGELDFASLAQLLTGSAEPTLRPAGIAGRELYVFRKDIGMALEARTADALSDIAVAWSTTAPWAGAPGNPFDLAGFLLDWKQAWHQAMAPDKAMFLWLDA